MALPGAQSASPRGVGGVTASTHSESRTSDQTRNVSTFATSAQASARFRNAESLEARVTRRRFSRPDERRERETKTQVPQNQYAATSSPTVTRVSTAAGHPGRDSGRRQRVGKNAAIAIRSTARKAKWRFSFMLISIIGMVLFWVGVLGLIGLIFLAAGNYEFYGVTLDKAVSVIAAPLQWVGIVEQDAIITPFTALGTFFMSLAFVIFCMMFVGLLLFYFLAKRTG